jgi:peptide/nickel transport system substrate-binding protein
MSAIAPTTRRRWLLVGAAGALVLMSGPLLAALFVSVLGGPATAVAAQYKPPSVLRINLQGTLDSVDPAFAFQQVSVQLEYATCAKLMNYPDGPWTADQQPVPEVAAGSPAISADRKTYTFKLQTSFHFSTPAKEIVTAESFKHALERALAPGVDSPAIFYVRDIVGVDAYHAGQASSISGITIGKKKELVIHLERPSGDFLARLATPLLFCAVPLDAPPAGQDAVVASAGPYYVESFNRDGTTVLRRNPNYGGKRPQSFDAIVYRAHVPAATSEADVVAGNVDYAADGLPIDDYASIAAAYGPGSPAAQAGHQQLFINGLLSTRYVVFNVTRPLFSSVQLRKAVNYALDRPAMQDAQGRYANTPTDQILPPGMPGFRDRDLYPVGGPDLATAQALATSSGKVPATAVLYVPEAPAGHRLAQVIRDDLAQIGIDVQPQFISDDIFARLRTPGEPYDLATAGWLADYPDPWDFIDALLHGKNAPGAGGSDNNYGSFDDPTFNQRMDDAAVLQPPARYDAYADLDHDLMADAAPWAPWGNPNARDFFSARIGCQTFNPFFGMDLAALCLR